MIKSFLSYIIWLSLHLGNMLHINHKKILIIPKNGSFYCNLKYMSNYITKYYPQFSLVWAIDKRKKWTYPVESKTCNKNGFSFWMNLLTAKVVIFNDLLPTYYYKKREQYYINTWHGGGAYKRIATVYRECKDQYRKERVKRAIINWDYFISSCSAFTDAIMEDTNIKNVNPKMRFISSGMPRNDIFFNKKQMNIVQKKIRDLYSVPKNKKIVLYAPTFRETSFKNNLAVSSLLDTLKCRFGKDFLLMLRSHPHVAKDIFKKNQGGKNILDVSAYPDMQELLCAADVLITDYSSCMWDYSFTGKPCFIYANDIESYKTERDFHTPMERWPFPIAQDNEELQENILHFDEEQYKKNIENHHRQLGSYEDGHATERICKLIAEICGEIS